ncbi:hypothetical protein EDD86DRAFT_258878 [Gorgonomyces haynaldii]|nr:hypothetical protein EDD86DRAFT_258878 [Gorgonomyces haynaldii]
MLPDEIWLQVFEYAQPYYRLKTEDIWQYPTNHTQTWTLNDRELQLENKKGSMWQHNGYHRTIRLSYGCIPILLLLSRVCKRFRNLVFWHPFWTQLSLHYLIRKPYGLTMWKGPLLGESSIIRRTIKMILFDFALFNVDMDVKQLIQTFKIIRDPLAVEDIVLHMDWRLLGDHKFVQHLGLTFPHVKRIHFQGRAEKAIFGFDDKAVRIMAKRWKHLTHVYLQSHGLNSYSFKSVLKLIHENPQLTHLTIGCIPDSLEKLEHTQLKHLTIISPDVVLPEMHCPGLHIEIRA